MVKSIAQPGIPFAAASAPIREAHRTKKALSVRLPILSMHPNPQKQKSLQRPEKMHTDTRASASKRLPTAPKIYPFAARSNIIRVNGSCNPASSSLRGEVAIQTAQLPKSRKRCSTPSNAAPRAWRSSRAINRLLSHTSVTSRDRLRTALEHREPDRIPLDFGSTSVTGIHVSCVAALRHHYGLVPGPVKVHEPYQMLGLVEDDLRAAMGLDVSGVFPRQTMFGFPAAAWKEWNFHGLDVLVPGDFRTRTEPNGDIVIFPEGDEAAAPSGRMPLGSAFFDSIVRQPEIDDEKLDPADNLEEFAPVSEADLDHIERSVRAAGGGGYGVAATFGGTAFGDIALVPAPFLKNPKGIRDITEWYISTRTRRGYIHRIFERQCEIGLANLARIHARIGDAVDCIFVCGTDFGTQTSAFCSVPTFRELWFPYYQRVNNWVHANTAWKCFKHSCGSVERFFESFIQAGFDIVNPVQCSAAGMDPAELKRKYGSRLVFWGGGVDTQKTLPFGTPQEVREEVLRRCEIFAPGGGFVFNSIHNLQAGTPVENIVAMLGAVHEFNGVAHA